MWVRPNITRGQQGFIYRVAERLHNCDSLSELSKAIEHAKKVGWPVEVLTALCLIVVWRDKPYSELYPMIEATRRGKLPIASGLAASGLARAKQLEPCGD